MRAVCPFAFASPVRTVVEVSKRLCRQFGFWHAPSNQLNSEGMVYECGSCRTVLRPKPGDCCVFCSYCGRSFVATCQKAASASIIGVARIPCPAPPASAGADRQVVTPWSLGDV